MILVPLFYRVFFFLLFTNVQTYTKCLKKRGLTGTASNQCVVFNFFNKRLPRETYSHDWEINDIYTNKNYYLLIEKIQYHCSII